MSNPLISQITLPSGNTYDIKDSYAREQIGLLTDICIWVGVTTTELTDGCNTSPIVIDNKEVAAKKGMVTAYTPSGETNAREFIYNGTIWQELGGLGLLKALAYKDSASGSFTPSGTNEASAVTFTGNTTDKVLGESTTFSASGTGVAISSPSSETFLKSSVTATVPKTSSTTKYLSASSGTTGTKTVSAVKNISNGSAATWTATVQNEILSFSWAPNTPTSVSSEDVTVGSGGDSVITGISSADTTSTGAVAYISNVSTSGTDSVTFASGHTAAAITAIGDIIVTDPSISVGTNDKVDAITALGTGTAAAQKFTGTQSTVTVS